MAQWKLNCSSDGYELATSPWSWMSLSKLYRFNRRYLPRISIHLYRVGRTNSEGCSNNRQSSEKWIDRSRGIELLFVVVAHTCFHRKIPNASPSRSFSGTLGDHLSVQDVPKQRDASNNIFLNGCTFVWIYIAQKDSLKSTSPHVLPPCNIEIKISSKLMIVRHKQIDTFP